jgi:succinate dehydrogenase / fumarate reductase, cytochrome b subunit
VETPPVAATGAPQSSFLLHHQFLIYRLFSLSGIVPIGGYMAIHLLTNATILDSVAMFQDKVDGIHSLGVALPAIEWSFIFLPLLFHASVGWLIIRGAVPNTSQYRTMSNVRYVLQRATGIVAFFYILFHVIHLHHLGSRLGGGKFVVDEAASSTGNALQTAPWLQAVYVVGVLACVYHFCNGLWTGGITWGLWTTPVAQKRANWISIGAGVFLAGVGLSALWGFANVDVSKARVVEHRMEQERLRLRGEEPRDVAPHENDPRATAFDDSPAGPTKRE